jgi:hypothetical protein
MEQISVPVPIPGEGETMDIQVTVGGRTKLLRYRVEALRFRPQADADERFEQLRTFIRDYDDAWALVQIGAPGGDTVPLTFRQRPAPEVGDGQDDDAEPERST